MSRRDGVATYIARASVATYAKGRRDNGATYDKHVKEVDNHHEKRFEVCWWGAWPQSVKHRRTLTEIALQIV